LAEWISSCGGLPPCVKPILPFGVVARSSKKVPFRPEVSSEDAVDFEKALHMLRRLEALHAALSLSGRLMRVLSTVVQVSALSTVQCDNAVANYSQMLWWLVRFDI
jgi:hypothetical protein